MSEIWPVTSNGKTTNAQGVYGENSFAHEYWCMKMPFKLALANASRHVLLRSKY